MDLFAKSWKGEASLAKAFWLVYVLGIIIIGIIITILISLVIPHLNYLTHNNLVMTILFPYTLFSSICVWRCAKNSSVFWRILAKIIVILGIISGLFHIYYLINPPHIVPLTPTSTPTPTST